MMKITTIRLDLAKSVFQGAPYARRHLSCSQLGGHATTAGGLSD